MSPLDDPDIIKIATLKIAKETERISREVEKDRTKKKAELSQRGLLMSRGMIASMQNLNLRSLEGRVQVVYSSWKEALVETGNQLTPELLEKIRDKAAEILKNAPSTLAASLREQCRGLYDVVDKISSRIEDEVNGIHTRFWRRWRLKLPEPKSASDRSQYRQRQIRWTPSTKLTWIFFPMTTLKR